MFLAWHGITEDVCMFNIIPRYWRPAVVALPRASTTRDNALIIVCVCVYWNESVSRHLKLVSVARAAFPITFSLLVEINCILPIIIPIARHWSIATAGPVSGCARAP